MAGDRTKAANYIQQLDRARCSGEWANVPELVRKIRKHAPERACLTLTAESEHAILQSSHGGPSAATTKISSRLDHLIVPLNEAIENERTYVEDEFQAKVCVGWIYWVTGEPKQAVSHLPDNIEREFAGLDSIGKESSAWTRVCALKASYIKAASFFKFDSSKKALESLNSSLPMLSAIGKTESGEDQRNWTEHLVTLLCMLSGHAVVSNTHPQLELDELSGFRIWADFWTRQSSTPTGGRAAHSEFTRRQVWKEYYATLSTILQHDLSYPTTSIESTYADISSRETQRAELQVVETKYESLLLSEVQFPSAEEASEEVEVWVELVVSNWRVLCGNKWQESDLGQGGREALSRGVLDILYRAATKTFHSTRILRYLFTVHLALAEFELAFKAFDTYLEIVNKEKARVEKTGEDEIGLDNDEMVLKTISDSIRALCRYGSRESAERSQQLSKFLEQWLEKHYPDDSVQTNGNGNTLPTNGSVNLPLVPITPKILAIAWRSIGISQAQWARLTFDAGSRTEIQLKAVENLRKALSPQFESSDDIETLFALAMILAERRELSSAIDVVKAALLPLSANKSNELSSQGKFAREKSLIPLWHLLALLLSARQEFTTAARACEGAFEQFQNPMNLFGQSQLNFKYRSEHLNHLELQSIGEKPTTRNKGVVDDMDDFEREALLEVKVTQLVLIEVLDGPEVAVNASDELLSLYSRLFGEPHQPTPTLAKAAQHNPPASSAGTLRSIKGSIFGRSKRSFRKSSSIRGRETSQLEEPVLSARPQTSQTVASTITSAPTIQVTNENGSSTKEPHHREKLHKNPSLSRKKSHGSVRNRSTSTNRVRSRSRGTERSTDQGEHLNATRLSQVGLAISPDIVSLSGETSRQSKQSATQETHLAYLLLTNPKPRFSKDQELRRRKGVLIKVWLLIAGFYRRAKSYDDAKGAIDEAYKLVDFLEMNVSKDISGQVTLASGGWGSGKSVEELWADVLAERGYLEVAQKSPYTALSEFELALTHFADHPSATVGLSNILLDIYSETLRPPPPIPVVGDGELYSNPSISTLNIPFRPITSPIESTTASSVPAPILHPLGLPSSTTSLSSIPSQTMPNKEPTSTSHLSTSALELPHKANSTAILDRLAARDRAYGLLSAITKLGTAWTCSEAWYALARAYEEGGQVDKAREVLWWCVELEEGRGVRDWSVCGVGGYVL